MKKYSEDYEIDIVTDDRGRTKDVAVYKGDYYDVSLDEAGVPRFKKINMVLLVLIAFWHLAAGFVGNRGMYQFFVALPYVAAFFPLVYLAIGIFSLPHEKKNYRRDEIGLSYDRMKSSTIFLMATLGAGILGEVVYLIFLSTPAERLFEFFYLSLELMVMAAAFLVFTVRKKVIVSLVKKQEINKLS